MPFAFTPLSLPDLLLIEPKLYADARGFFLESYKASAFAPYGIPPFVQTNHSHSVYGVLRGLHYQLPPFAQGKLVMAVRGVIFDVGVDLRRSSPTFGRWAGVILSEENHRLLYIPPGFAHGFCVLSDEADVIYQVTAEYAPQADRGVRWDDPTIGVEWPIEAPLLSPKDAAQPLLEEAELFD